VGIYQRGKVWWIDYYDQKRRRIQESLQSTNKRDAEELLTLRKAEVLRGVHKRMFQEASFGGMGEWLKPAVLKTVIPRERDRGFESLSLRHPAT
jgi:hypothetical protein